MAAPLSERYLLNSWNVAMTAPHGVPGAFAIFRAPDVGAMTAVLVGRSDDDLARAIQTFIQTYDGGNYYYAYAPATSARAAFEWECELFHRWSPEDNPVHPERTPGSDWVCAICGPEILR